MAFRNVVTTILPPSLFPPFFPSLISPTPLSPSLSPPPLSSPPFPSLFFLLPPTSGPLSLLSATLHSLLLSLSHRSPSIYPFLHPSPSPLLPSCIHPPLLSSLQDFMRECEQQTDQYSDLYCHGNCLAAKYKPSDALDAMMTSLHNRWAGHVTQMGERSEELLGIQELWEKYEGEVKKLLNWIMAEAERFSCEVTTLGDKGIKSTAPRPEFPKAARPCAPFALERDADAFISSPHARRKVRKPRSPRESREKRRRRPSRHTRGSSDGRPNRMRPALTA